mgnify:CR=1 FL=1
MHLRFSQDIKALLERLAEQPLTLEMILSETSERGFSLVIGLLVLPFLVPMPPGSATLMGGACLLLSLQMIIGKRSPWLPRRVAQFQFPTVLTRRILNHLQRITNLAERFVRPRLIDLAKSHLVWQINGACLSWLTLLLMSPIPMTNIFPTTGILVFVVATLETDGLLLCVGYGLTLLITALFGVIFYLLWRSPELLQQWL